MNGDDVEEFVQTVDADRTEYYFFLETLQYLDWLEEVLSLAVRVVDALLDPCLGRRRPNESPSAEQ